MGRQQYAIKKTVGENILKYGYCIHPTSVVPELHPEQGPVWEWIYRNMPDVYERLGANLDKEGAGTLRKIPSEVLEELKAIFDISGGTELFDKIEDFSRQKAVEMGFADSKEGMEGYFNHVYKTRD
jgi:heterodisulfide reductase subunit C